MAIDATDAWNMTRGEKAVIAILDTGLNDSDLPGLRSREIGAPPLADHIGHGTSVATVAAGSGDLGVWGVAPGARVLPLSILDANGAITPQAIVDAIRTAVAEGASVINMSFGEVSDNPLVTQAIASAVSDGVVIVAAGGDTGSPQSLFPANLHDVIAARALGKDGRPSLYSNGSGTNGVDAPGEAVPAVRGKGVYESAGSSIATAIVSGAVALLESCALGLGKPRLGPAQILTALEASRRQGVWFNLGYALRTLGC